MQESKVTSVKVACWDLRVGGGDKVDADKDGADADKDDGGGGGADGARCQGRSLEC